MIFRFGAHAGEPAELIVLTDPGYVAWALREDGATGPLARARPKLRRLVRLFDEKPLRRRCQAPGCPRRATRGSADPLDTQLSWWCDACDPSQHGAPLARVKIIQSFREAAAHADLCFGDRDANLRGLIGQLARAKGLPARAGEEDVVAFFE